MLAVVLSRIGRLGVERDLAIAALRAAVQLAAVGALIALVFEHAGLAAAFVALMSRRRRSRRAGAFKACRTPPCAAALPSQAAPPPGSSPCSWTGAFDTTPR